MSHFAREEIFLTFFIRHSACARIPIISGQPELDSGL